MSTSFELAANSIGTLAYAACQSPAPANVIGVTSRGLFLRVLPQRIIFVSFEHYRSPLTINLDQSFDRLSAIEIGAMAQLSGARLIFPSIESSISLSENAIWYCPLPTAESQPDTEQRRMVQMIAQGVLARRHSAGWAAILPRLVDLPDALPLSAEQAIALDRLIALRHAIQTSDSQAVIFGLTGLLGQGSGLTPSGDDVVIGLLLILARSLRLKSHTGREYMLKQVTAPIVSEAYRRTTAISANLIECAAAGQGDERLINVADGIAAGSASIGECIDCVLEWGSSSGIDALAGMALAVTS